MPRLICLELDKSGLISSEPSLLTTSTLGNVGIRLQSMRGKRLIGLV